MVKSLSKIFLFFIIIFSLLSISFFDNVKAGTDYTCNFDDGIIGTDYTWTNAGTTVMVTSQQSNTGDFEISNQHLETGSTRDFEVDDSPGWWNLTLNSSGFLTGFKVKIYDSSTSKYYLNFMNNSQWLRDITMVVPPLSAFSPNYAIRLYDDNTNMRYYDYTNTSTIITGSGGANWVWLEWELTGNDTVIYTYKNVTTTGTPLNISFFTGGSKIDRITMYNDDGAGHEVLFDDLTLTYSTGYGAGSNTSTCGEAPTGLTKRGTLVSNTYYSFIKQPYIRQYYVLPINATLYYVDLDIGASQYNSISSTLTDYTCYLENLGENKVNIGSPNCAYNINGQTVLRWYYSSGFHMSSNKIFLMTFYCSASDGSGNHWSFGIGGSSQDLDGDAVTTNLCMLYSYDGTSTYIYNYDLSYNIWYLTSYKAEESGYSTSLTISGEAGLISNGTQYYYVHDSTYGTVFIQYMLSQTDLTNGAKLHVYSCDNGTEYGGIGLNELLDKKGFSIGFIPDYPGNYNVTLKTTAGALLKEKNFNVTWASDTTKQIWTKPNPSYGTSNILIYWNYTHPSGWWGAIGISKDLSISTKDECDYWYEGILSGTTGSRSFPPEGGVQAYYMRLFVSMNGSEYNFQPYGDIHKHLIYSSMDYDVLINANPDSVVLNNNFAEQTGVNLCWKHSFLGAKLVIKINDAIVFDERYGIGDLQLGCLRYTPSTAGNKKVTLEKNEYGTYVNLATCYFNVTLEPIDTTEQPGILPAFAPEMGALVGVVVIVCFTLLPLLITVLLNRGSQSEISVHPLVYAMFMVIGLVISVQLGLFEMWVLFLVMFILILIVAVLWLSKSSGGEG